MTDSLATTCDFYIAPADYRVDFEALRSVRETVFVLEQNVPIEEEWDELDPLCRHVLARDGEGRAIGTARMTRDGKIGRIAVLKDWRGKGVGAALLTTLLDRARSEALPEVRLNAQVAALAFYHRFGFESVGPRFMEAGIEHQAMRLHLTPVPAPPRAASDLPASAPLRVVATLAEAVTALTEAIAGGRQLLRIHSRDLDPALLGHADVLAALKTFAIDRRAAQVRVLIQDVDAARSRRNGLFDLAQRLSSCFQFRAAVEAQDLDFPAAYLVSDRGGLLYRPLAGRFEGEASACLPARARPLIEHFDAVWERARPCTEFRALGI